MKTEDLYLEYARVIKMCEGTEVRPWECIRGKGDYYNTFVSLEASTIAFVSAQRFCSFLLDMKVQLKSRVLIFLVYIHYVVADT